MPPALLELKTGKTKTSHAVLENLQDSQPKQQIHEMEIDMAQPPVAEIVRSFRSNNSDRRSEQEYMGELFVSEPTYKIDEEAQNKHSD
jgi:hypothetical protein